MQFQSTARRDSEIELTLVLVFIVAFHSTDLAFPTDQDGPIVLHLDVPECDLDVLRDDFGLRDDPPRTSSDQSGFTGITASIILPPSPSGSLVVQFDIVVIVVVLFRGGFVRIGDGRPIREFPTAIPQGLWFGHERGGSGCHPRGRRR